MLAEHFELHADDYEDMMTMDDRNNTPHDERNNTPHDELRKGDRVEVVSGRHAGAHGTVTGFGTVAGSALVKLDKLGWSLPGFTVRKL